MLFKAQRQSPLYYYNFFETGNKSRSREKKIPNLEFSEIKAYAPASDLEFNYVFFNLKYSVKITAIFMRYKNSVLKLENL